MIFSFLLLTLSQVWCSRRSLQSYDREALQCFRNSSERECELCFDDAPDLVDLVKVLEVEGELKNALIQDTFKKPASRQEALEMCIREIVLHQRFSEEKMNLLRDLESNPELYVDLVERLDELGFKTWKSYMDSKVDFLWGNVLLRWASYALEHPEATSVYDAFFQVILECAYSNWDRARIGIDILSKGRLEPFSEADHLYLYTARVRLIDENLFRNTWFQDAMTNCAFVYAKMAYLLVHADRIRDGFPSRVLAMKLPSIWPKIYQSLNDRIYARLTYLFTFTGKSNWAYLTTANMDSACENVLKNVDLHIATDILDDEQVTGSAIFEASYFFNLISPKMPKKKTEQVANLKKSNNGGKRQPNRKARKAKGASSSTSGSFSREETKVAEKSSPLTPCIDIPARMADSDPVSNMSCSYGSLASSSDLVSGSVSPSSRFFVKNSVVKTELTATDDIFIEETTIDEVEEEMLLMDSSFSDWIEQKEAYRMRDKIIRQNEKEMAASRRLEKLGKSSKDTGKNAKTTVRQMRTPDFCAAFPSAHELFTKNHGTICNAGAKQYQWVFDDKVKLKSKNFSFLCKLFGLSKAGEISYERLRKTFYEIEGPSTKKQQRFYFRFTHRFEILHRTFQPAGTTLDSETSSESFVSAGKEVHPEHASSRFNWIRAQDLFEGAGLDPRFFIPIYA